MNAAMPLFDTSHILTNIDAARLLRTQIEAIYVGNDPPMLFVQ